VISAETIKMPEPIIDPATIAAESNNERPGRKPSAPIIPSAKRPRLARSDRYKAVGEPHRYVELRRISVNT
jgi:hypothetical protein